MNYSNYDNNISEKSLTSHNKSNLFMDEESISNIQNNNNSLNKNKENHGISIHNINGPQQKRKKRKYRRREKGKNDYDIRDEKKLNDYCNNYNASIIKNILNESIEKENNIYTNTYNEYLTFNDAIHFKDKEVINNKPPIVPSESINYVVINYYYKYFHPLYPIINYNSFAVHAKNGTLTKYLLYAMYGMAYYFKPDTNNSEALEYIENTKTLILQNYGVINVQLLQAICLISIIDSGNDKDWLSCTLGIRTIIDNSLWFMNVKKSNYVLKEDIEDMKNISLILLSYDTWINITHNSYQNILQQKLFIKERSKLLMNLTSETLSNDYECFISCINIFMLEIYHIVLKIKLNKVSIEEIDYYIEQKKWNSFFLLTIAQRIYINRKFIINVINDTVKIKKFPIAKSIAIVCKSADDCTICLKLLYEASEINNSLPLRFPFIKAWVFYQCAIIYCIRYIATYENKYNGNNRSSKYSTFSSFPQETLEPSYFYLNILKEMCEYFVSTKYYVKSLKKLIYDTKRAVNERIFDVNFDDVLV
ncbi:hypothetical protein H8356DRAFT_1399573 [Neocallimastix lanati (nom. inval.)]|nr:hypothetical protein H8356DRAFT_1399573 [Neocallimastix sp. JGI-2020a]